VHDDLRERAQRRLLSRLARLRLVKVRHRHEPDREHRMPAPPKAAFEDVWSNLLALLTVLAVTFLTLYWLASNLILESP
jgi:hypothetical protein